METWRIPNVILNTPPRILLHLARLKIWPQTRLESFTDEHPCVFFLATGRAGTATLAQICGLAKNVFAYHEPHPELFGLSKASYTLTARRPRDESVESALQAGFLTARRELMDYSLFCRRGYVETGPQATFLAPLILRSVPNVKFIHLVRDPKKFTRSGMRRKWYEGHPYDRWRITPVPDSAFGKRWEGFSPLEKNLWLWAETNRWALDFSKTLPPGRCLLARSEDVFASDPDTLERIFNLLGTASPSAKKIRHILGRQLNEQVEGTFKEPEDWLAELDKELARFVQETAAGLGYEFS
jgi:hypothetical protein